MTERHGARERLRSDSATGDAIALFGSELPGADLRSALLDVAAQRSAAATPRDVLRQYGTDRFVAPGVVDPVILLRVAHDALASLTDFEAVNLAPLVPLGTHGVGSTPQNNVVTTTRLSEVAADPTNALALEAAVRRKQLDVRRSAPTRLAGVQRVVRAQRFDGPISFAHFSLLGLVSAGRTTGSRRFEVDETVRHCAALVGAVCAARPDAEAVELVVSDFSTETEDLSGAVQARFADLGVAECRVSLDREHGRGDYSGLCFKLNVTLNGQILEVGDGGAVPWMQDLLADAKERLVIGGLGLDRLALDAPARR